MLCGTIWWQRSRSALAQVMACCLIAPSHYRNQYWFIISKDLWQLPDRNFTRETPVINRLSYLLEKLLLCNAILSSHGSKFKVGLWDLNNTFGESENVFARSLSSMSERLLYKYNNKVELVNTHMTKRKEWLWCSGNNIYPYVHNKHNYQRKQRNQFT